MARGEFMLPTIATASIIADGSLKGSRNTTIPAAVAQIQGFVIIFAKVTVFLSPDMSTTPTVHTNR